MDKEECKRLMCDRAICVIIPTYNNVGSIARVVESVQAYCDDVIVADDGSDDGTSAILEQMPRLTVLRSKRNHGKGHALKHAFRHARAEGYAYAITIDADGQHYADDIPRFVEANMEHPGALIVGSRNMEGAERSAGSRFANKFSNFWFAVQTCRVLDDTQTGYRLYPLKKQWGLWLLTNRYEAELELLVGASWHGVPIHSIPVRVYYPPSEERVSHFRPAIDFARISVLNTVLCVLAVVYALPLAVFRFLWRTIRTLYALLLLVVFCFLIATPLVWLYVNTRRMNEQRKLRLHRMIQGTARFFMEVHGIPGARFSKKVAEGVDFDRPHIVICNHQSHLDLLCQLLFTPRMIFLTKEWVWHSPFYGYIIRHAEFYPVTEGIEALLPKLQSLADRGYSIALYPEGTRSADCRIARFHKGAFWLSSQLNLPILPMYLYGAGKVLPKKSRHLRSGVIHIEVDAALTREELEAMGSERQQANAMRRRYKERYQAMANRIEQDV